MQNGLTRAKAIRGILLDLGGVVYSGKTPIPGALRAIEKVRATGLDLRFITNTTRRSRSQVLSELRRMGLDIMAHELLTPAQLARSFLIAHGLAPFLVVHPNLDEDFAGLSSSAGEAVVIGDAGPYFTYERLNTAFRKIIAGAPFLALAKNRNFKDDDGEPSLDAGPFVVALEYASHRNSIVLGKPSAEFFALAIDGLECGRSAVAMIGDDAESDVGGAMTAGMTGILVRTGKYRQGDELALASAPHHVAGDLSEAIAWILRDRSVEE